MSIRLIIIALLGLTIAATVTTLCMILLPARNNSRTLVYEYTVRSNGDIIWHNTAMEDEKLSIHSNVLQYLDGYLNQTSESDHLECNQVFAKIDTLDKPQGDVQCWKIQTMHGGTTNCGKHPVIVRDCISMSTQNNDTIYWFGGAEMISQKWPINSMNLPRKTSFLSSDLPKRHGNVLERYFLSSLGAAVYIEPNVPLYVSVIQGDKICLEASYNQTQLVGPLYLESETVKSTALQYIACLGENTKIVHQAMTNLKDGFIKRPKIKPDLQMMKEPIWSTWARYKSSINQTVVENFADEILFYNFTNSQLEIDDGYEKEYGDFVFDKSKFPAAKSMTEKLHSKGFRVTTWVTPFINLNSENYAYAKKQGFFVPKERGAPEVIVWWNGRGSVIDFTNERAAEWYKETLKEVKSRYGVDSFKFDAGEISYLPKAGLNYAASRWSNPSYYTTAYANAAFGVGGTMAEMRSSWKTQDIGMYMRLMDKGSSWGSLRGFQTVIPTALIFGIIGYPYVLPDMIGGNAYALGSSNAGIPERELYIRWIELGAFLPCMQFSISPWQYDKEVVEIAQKYVALHRTFIYKELVRAAENYISGNMSLLVAPIWFQEPKGNSKAFEIDDQFMVGDKYLVAPIVEKGSVERDIYLPGDVNMKWKDMMRADCSISDAPNCVVNGGTWVKSYKVPLDQISWWEKLN